MLFYVLHQTVIVAIGFHVLPSGLEVFGKFAAIATMSFATTVLAYALAIRPIALVSGRFGLKRAHRRLATP